ncbi:MAG TPA: lysylphosphatidylglycerol synthase domain-containing protein [Gaiellaceae bacterium]|nr:lysylphosphatidylglycerol synthase domain-containing protein [Gaiellaceae bacterium]
MNHTIAAPIGRSLAPRKVLAGMAFCALSVVACFLLARRMTGASWPLERANLGFVALAAVGYVASFGFRALGWQRIFPGGERPHSSRCLAACGASAASGTVLPFRLDYVVKVATLKRLHGMPLGIDTIAVSINTLGLIDAVAMLPLAVAALSTADRVFFLPLLVVVLVCLGATAVVLGGRRLLALIPVGRWERASGVVHRVGESVADTRGTLVAGAFLFGCWTSRALGSTCLLMALGTGFTPRLAIVVLCLAAAAAVIPVTAGGAVAGMGATAAILLALGTSKNVAINFSLASATLLTLAALTAALIGVTGSVVVGVRGRQPLGVAP